MLILSTVRGASVCTSTARSGGIERLRESLARFLGERKEEERRKKDIFAYSQLTTGLSQKSIPSVIRTPYGMLVPKSHPLASARWLATSVVRLTATGAIQFCRVGFTHHSENALRIIHFHCRWIERFQERFGIPIGNLTGRLTRRYRNGIAWASRILGGIRITSSLRWSGKFRCYDIPNV